MNSNNPSGTDFSNNKYKVLAIDIGGTNVKLLASGQKEMRKVPSGPTLTPPQMVSQLKAAGEDWPYEVICIGDPGPVVQCRPTSQPFKPRPRRLQFDFRK